VTSDTSAQKALDLLTQKVSTEAGRADIQSSLNDRLGGGMSRLKMQTALRKELPQTQPLFRDLIEALTLPEKDEVASEIVRILENAVNTRTSEDLMRRALGVVLTVLTDPKGRNVKASTSGDKERTGGSAKLSGQRDPLERRALSVRVADLAGAGPETQGYDPHGAFRIPDRVVRFGPDGGSLAAPLFPVTPSEHGVGPVRVPAALLAPPNTKDPELIRGWLRGAPSFPDSLAVRAGLLDTGDPGDLMEIEAEFHADPNGALRLYKAAAPMDDGTADAAWCARLGRDIGRFGVTHERGAEILVQAVRDQMAGWPSARLAPLKRAGSVLVVREELAEAVCGLIDAEAEYLADGPQNPTGPDQNLLGAFSPSCDLSRGRCLERALILHVTAAVPMGTAMRQSLSEFRLAQAMCENPDAPIDFVGRRFDLDPALPLAELCGREPIIRIGFTEPALS
jgi:hypothetical protein